MNRVTIAVATFAVPLLALSALQKQPTRYVALDGDTIQHGAERIRLLYIDAPEMPGHCRPGRECVAGDPYAAKAALQEALDSGHVRCEGEARDRYGRRLAECFVTAPESSRTVSVNEWMLAAHHALPYRYRGSSR